MGNNEENDSKDYLPLFPLLDLDEEKPSEITSVTNDGKELEDNLENEVKTKVNLELIEDEMSKELAIVEKVDVSQTRAKNASEDNLLPKDAEN